MAADSIYDRKTFGPGKLLIRPGDPPLHAYLVQAGRARVFSTDGMQRVPLAEIGAGEIVGDMALIRKSRHHYGVEAIETVVAVVVSVQHIQALLDEADPLLRTILSGMVQRIDRLNGQRRPGEVWFV
jgi:CRP-like cAMP-binding protein